MFSPSTNLQNCFFDNLIFYVKIVRGISIFLVKLYERSYKYKSKWQFVFCIVKSHSNYPHFLLLNSFETFYCYEPTNLLSLRHLHHTNQLIQNLLKSSPMISSEYRRINCPTFYVAVLLYRQYSRQTIRLREMRRCVTPVTMMFLIRILTHTTI